MKTTTLYFKTATGAVNQWSIYRDGIHLCMEYGAVDGEMTEKSEPIVVGLGGRTISEQFDMRIKSRINKKRDKGYVDTYDEALKNQPRNQLGYKKAAKCKAFKGSDGNVSYKGMTGIQNKLNGYHASVINDNGRLVMYSSNGKVVSTLPEVLEGLEIPKGRLIEGELYHHGTPLQTIGSWIRRRQESTNKINFHIYDTDVQVDYIQRYGILNAMKINSRCVIVHTDFVQGHFNLEPLLKKAIEEKYEGKILRLEGYGHEDGKRGAGLIKVKPRHFENFLVDDEFLVVDIIASKDNWARLVCETEDGVRFKVSCHGTINYKESVLERKDLYIGKHIRAEFESYTKGKVPFQPVALYWRDKFEE